MTEPRVALPPPRIRELRRTGAYLLLAIGTSFASVASAGQGVWTSGGPYGGNVRALATSPLAPATLYAGMSSGGVFKSNDSGATWSSANTGLTNWNVLALVVHPTIPATLYAGTSGGVFKSTDSGLTWVPANTGLTRVAVNSLAINPATPSTLYAGTSGGVFKSTDSGGTWAAANTGLDVGVGALAIDPSNPATLYAGLSPGGVIKSRDSGATWAPANTGIPGVSVSALIIDPSTPASLWAVGSGVVLKSTDAGGTWASSSNGVTKQVTALAINPSTPSTLYCGTEGSGVFKSADSGATWSATGLTDVTILALAVNPAVATTVYAGTYLYSFPLASSAVYRSTDSGGTWATASNGLTGLSIFALAINTKSPATLYAGADLGPYKSADSGRTWSASTVPTIVGGWGCGTFLALATDPSDPATVYGGTSGGGVCKSTDSGETWSTTVLTNLTVQALAINPKTPTTLYAGASRGAIYTTMGGGVFKSTDSGGTWAPAGLSPQTALTGLDIFALAIDPLTPTTLYAGVGLIPYSVGGVVKSTDGGDRWASASTGLPNLYISALAINPSTPSTLYAGTIGAGVFKSTDSGGTWSSANAGLTNVNVQALAISSSTPSTLYAGTSGGIFKSTDAGRTWAAISAGLPSTDITALALDTTGVTTLYVGLAFGSVWQATPPPDGITSIEGFVPIVLDVTGLAHYSSELQLTNLATTPTTVSLAYTSSIGEGTGRVQETIPAGQQVVYPDAVSHFRTRGVPIPTSGSQGGTLLVSAPAAGVHATVRTGSDTVSPLPVGRAGLAYTETPVVPSSDWKIVLGLRTSDADRSNLAIYNMGAEPISLSVSLVSGDDGRSIGVTAGAPQSLPAYGWYQYNNIFDGAGFSSGYAIINRASGSGPFGAYGVVNDRVTNDGSLIPALSDRLGGSRITVPVLVETSAFESELILINRGNVTPGLVSSTFTLRYVESLSPASGTGGTTTVDVPVGRQLVIPNAIDFLRSKGVRIGARGEASYAGSLEIQVCCLSFFESIFAGTRTTARSPAGGQFGVFYPAVTPSEEFSDQAYVLGLKADANNRSNVAALHTGTEGTGPITLELQVLDGSEGGKAVGQPLSVTLQPGQWVQPPGFFASGGVPNGYVRIRRTAGTAPWYAYGVINDGGQPGQRTGDGSYVPGVRP